MESGDAVCKAKWGEKSLSFAIFIIHELAKVWDVPPYKVYSVLEKTKILDEYIIPCYDVLHTMGSEAICEDLTEFVREKETSV